MFWQEVYELLPKQADGLEVTSVTPQRRSVQQEPLQFYLREQRRLALQLMATAPKRVKARDRDYRRLDELLSVLHLSEERLTVQCHYFLAHYQARLLKHGNLQVVSMHNCRPRPPVAAIRNLLYIISLTPSLRSLGAVKRRW